MELTNDKLSIIVVVLGVILLLNIIFSIWVYFKLRNKKGPRGPKGERGPRGPRGPPN